MTFKDKRIIITGASSGIGEALAYQLAERGARIALAARRPDRLEAVAHSCRELGGHAIPLSTDVTDPKQCKVLIAQTVDEWDGLDGLIANAGIFMQALLSEITDLSLFERLMRVNYLGAVYCTYYALPYLKKSGGMIIGVSSLAGKIGVPSYTAYSASKFALHGFFDSLRAELLGTGVQVTIVCPGFVKTKLREYGLAGNGYPLTEDPVEEPYTVTAEECAETILEAAARGKREHVMTLAGKASLYVNLLSPRLIDRISRRKVALS